jgi:hypothetical protein
MLAIGAPDALTALIVTYAIHIHLARHVRLLKPTPCTSSSASVGQLAVQVKSGERLPKKAIV